ncbi:MAG: branched-chain amino acid ABC transporter permease [Sphaerobacter sp.]|nr:branched-chain amino acid ABC transporter permease [Sphaerobacter sp.]
MSTGTVSSTVNVAPAGLRRLGDAAGSVALFVAIGAFVAWSALTHPSQLVVGLVVGSVLALGALGLTLIYGVLKFAHFAHGDAMMLAAYLAFFVLSGNLVGTRGTDVRLPWSFADLPGATTPIWRFSFGYGLVLAVLVAGAVAALLLLLVDRWVYRPLRQRRAGVAIFAIVSLGVAIAMRSLILMIWGPTPRFYVAGIRPTVQILGGPRVVTDQLFIIAMAVVLAAAVYVLLYRTTAGRAMRAMADNPDLARVSGINTEAVVRTTWIVSGGLIAVAGSLLALQSQLKPELGFLLLLPVFAAAILGGIGSPHGALLGGLVVGVVQEVAVSVGILSPGYKFAIAFVILILVILVRPRGLFGA